MGVHALRVTITRQLGTATKFDQNLQYANCIDIKQQLLSRDIEMLTEMLNDAQGEVDDAKVCPSFVSSPLQ
jgi:hypothetical protein